MSLAYFTKINGGNEELWVTDGTIAGTRLVANMGPANPLGDDGIITTIGGRAFFSFGDTSVGQEIVTSDGTAAGTGVLKDINPGISDANPLSLTDVNGTLFFSANDGVHGSELWKSNGTRNGTVLVKDINPGIGDASPGDFTVVNGTVFFDADDGAHGRELWKTDGTAAGTQLVKDINSGAGDSTPRELTNVNGTLFFAADDGTHGKELWRSDGTAAGTFLIRDINTGAGDSNPNNFLNVNGTLFFAATDSTDGEELWRSDGTLTGTQRVKDINPGIGDSQPNRLVNLNGTVFFFADDGSHGEELWRSDGSSAGTVIVKDINVGVNGSAPSELINVGGTLFFVADDVVHGSELWKSDGTFAGTVLVKDIRPGATLGSTPFRLTNVNGVLEFYASTDGGATFDLYRSDGTAAGTFVLATNVDTNTKIGFSPLHPSDFSGDGNADILWRSNTGALANWLMNGNVITSGNFVTFNGTTVAPDASFSVAATADFNGDGNADVLWRSTTGELDDWTMNGSVIGSSAQLTFNGVAVRPDASFSVAGTGDFDGDTKSDILWRSTTGELDEWSMNGAVIAASAQVTFNGSVVRPDASFSVAGIGDFGGDGKRDILWRSTSGELDEWTMNGSVISASAQLTFNGAVVRPDASFSIAGIGDFNGDFKSDILWRSTSGAVIEWQMNGSVITSSGFVTSNGAPVSVAANWHVVETGDFDGNGTTDMLWRNDNGVLSEWLMNGNTIVQSVAPTFNGTLITPDATFTTQAKPTNFA